MSESKILKEVYLFELIREKTSGLNIANDIKDILLNYFEEKTREEISRFCVWAKELAELQGKKTILKKDLEFILNKLHQ